MCNISPESKTIVRQETIYLCPLHRITNKTKCTHIGINGRPACGGQKIPQNNNEEIRWSEPCYFLNRYTIEQLTHLCPTPQVTTTLDERTNIVSVTVTNPKTGKIIFKITEGIINIDTAYCLED